MCCPTTAWCGARLTVLKHLHCGHSHASVTSPYRVHRSPCRVLCTPRRVHSTSIWFGCTPLVLYAPCRVHRTAALYVDVLCLYSTHRAEFIVLQRSFRCTSVVLHPFTHDGQVQCMVFADVLCMYSALHGGHQPHPHEDQPASRAHGDRQEDDDEEEGCGEAAEPGRSPPALRCPNRIQTRAMTSSWSF